MTFTVSKEWVMLPAAPGPSWAFAAAVAAVVVAVAVVAAVAAAGLALLLQNQTDLYAEKETHTYFTSCIRKPLSAEAN